MSEWKTKKLGEVMDIKRGGSPRPIKKYITDSPDGINWIKISDATSSNKYIYKTKEKIKPSGLAKTRIVEEGDFILSNSMSFGKPYIVKTRGAIHDGWLLLKDKSQKHFESEFLYYLLSSSFIYNQFQLLAAGTTVKNLNVDLVSSVYVPIPPLPEQRHIVSKLDALFAEIDAAIALIDENTAKAEALKLSVLDEQLAKRNKQWKVEKLKTCFRLKSGENLTKKMMVTNGKYPVYGGNGITGHHNNHNLSGKNIIIGRVGALCGNVHKVDEEIWLTDNAFKLIDFKFDFDFSFLTYLLNYKDLRSYANQAAQPVISNRALKDVILTFPINIQKQKAIANIIEKAISVTDNLIQDYVSKRESLEALKSSILDKAFKGES